MSPALNHPNDKVVLQISSELETPLSHSYPKHDFDRKELALQIVMSHKIIAG